MKEQTNNRGILLLTLTFIGLPLLFYATGDLPRRTVLKESISIVTILAFCLMLAQFFLTRTNRWMLSGSLMSTIISTHKVIGYTFICVLLAHPFLIVVPRYYESGVEPIEAFFTIITTFTSIGVVLGICAWALLLILGVTSLFRKVLPLPYKTWRILHGILSALFIALASWHAIDLGRHTDSLLSSYVVITVVIGILLLLKTYISRPPVEQRKSK